MARAVVLTDSPPAQIVELDDSDLPEGDVTIDVCWSSLNYKDGLAVTGAGKIARTLPMTCGIDLAGTFERLRRPVDRGRRRGARHRLGTVRDPAGRLHRTATGAGRPGDPQARRALVAADDGHRHGGPDLDALRHGARGRRRCARRRPGSRHRRQRWSRDDRCRAARRHSATRSPPRPAPPHAHPLLRELGAAEIVDRDEFAAAGRPLAKERWAAVVDTVGSQTLASALSQIRYGGSVAACGLAGGSDLPATVLPVHPARRQPAWASIR